MTYEVISPAHSITVYIIQSASKMFLPNLGWFLFAI